MAHNQPRRHGMILAGALFLAGAVPVQAAHAIDSRFVNCSDEQQQVIASVVEEALSAGHAAYADLQSNPTSQRVQTWFGTSTSNIWNYILVEMTLDRALGHLQNDTITYDCSANGCNKCDHAWVVDGVPDEVTLCCQFFNGVPYANGGYALGPVLIHEMTHFDYTADTNCDSRDSARSLAQSDPNATITCAGNYQFFVEDPASDAPSWLCDPSQCGY